MTVPIRISEDGRDWALAACEEIAGALREAILARGSASLVLTGGGTPRAVYRDLAGMPYLEGVDWSRVSFFWGDERCVPPTDPQSNFRLAHESLLSRLPTAGPFYRIPAETGAAAAETYADTLRAATGVAGDQPPRFDVLLLGMGADGHVASLFPGMADLQTETRWVVATRSPAPPPDRISLSLRVINAARRIIFLVAGEKKASALSRVLEYDPATGEPPVPAALVRPLDGRVLWVVDRPATEMLKRK